MSRLHCVNDVIIRLPSLNMMKMQLYVFTQIIDLIEADQVRGSILYTIFSFN